ncbi:hypothetical protein IE53DRAFT_390626 [Violaceomyces palustris]|uniref:Uncharacterized protein n=1 Tax=Violaceomyces palustris TaxID=1673888 RepID=A0ACD0NN17_9BASI|nr:hypothetical protein IE53DRAFT_390626 [Violaceomyces palustris]
MSLGPSSSHAPSAPLASSTSSSSSSRTDPPYASSASASASASAYASSHLSLSVLALLSSTGFSRSSSIAADLLTEVLQRFIQLLGATCVQHANHCGRNQTAPQDVRVALECILGGDPISEVESWAYDEARLAVAQDLSPKAEAAQAAQTAPTANVEELAAASAAQEPSSQLDPVLGSLKQNSRGGDLSKRLRVGRPKPRDPSNLPTLRYTRLSSEEFQQVEYHRILEEEQIKRLIWGNPRKGSKGKERAVDDMDIDEDGRSGTGPSDPDDDDIDFMESVLSSAESGEGAEVGPAEKEEEERSGLIRSTLKTSSPPLVDADSDHELQVYKKRKLSMSRREGRRSPDDPPEYLQIEHIPAHLPELPLASSLVHLVSQEALERYEAMAPKRTMKAEQNGQVASPTRLPKSQEVDAEYAEEISSRREKLPAEGGLAGSRENEEEGSVQPIPSAEARDELNGMAQIALRQCWKEAIPFESSSLSESHPASEVPAIDEEILAKQAATAEVNGIDHQPSNSSLRAFAADLRSLSEDPTTSSLAGLLLTPVGQANQEAAAKRRRLAQIIADPNRYVPNDSLYASVAAKPTITPFIPGPSWLIARVPPPSTAEEDPSAAAALSAPVLQPVHPHGRPATLIPPSGALVPSLSYRHPTHLSSGARLISGPDLLRKTSRYHDPPPLLDDKHAERFFHFSQAGRELLAGSASGSGGDSGLGSIGLGPGGVASVVPGTNPLLSENSGSSNSILRPALEKLVKQLKAKEALLLPQVLDEEEQLILLQTQQLQGGTNDLVSSRIKHGNITLAHTWDWADRDPFDSFLPGKKVKLRERERQKSQGGGDCEAAKLGNGNGNGFTDEKDETMERERDRSDSIVNQNGGPASPATMES